MVAGVGLSVAVVAHLALESVLGVLGFFCAGIAEGQWDNDHARLSKRECTLLAGGCKGDRRPRRARSACFNASAQPAGAKHSKRWPTIRRHGLVELSQPIATWTPGLEESRPTPPPPLFPAPPRQIFLSPTPSDHRSGPAPEAPNPKQIR